MPVGPCLINQVTNQQFEKSLTPEERSMFWRYAKSIGADKGVDHATVVAQMAQDFGLPNRLVAQAMKGPKSLYKASEEVRTRQQASQRFLGDNRRYLSNMDKTGVQKLANFLNEGTRRILLLYHGPVPPVTHAIDVMANNPARFVNMYLRGFKALSEKSHNEMVANLQAQPYFKIFHDAGAPIGKEEMSTEGFHKTGWAGRAMDAALKPLRYELMAAKWEKLSPAEQTPEMAKHLATEFAHATGALVKGEPTDLFTRGFRKALLAPQLTPSKIAKTIIDPIETAKTFERLAESKFSSKIQPPTPEERIIAYNRVRRAATYLGVTLGALTVNEAILRATGSKQHVNYDDPAKGGDFLAYKFAGRSWRQRGTLEIISLLSKLAALGMQKRKYGQQSPEEAFAKYGEYKLTPGIGLGKELTTGKDVFGRPVPWSSDTGSDKFPRKNVMEFVGEHGPIFAGHAISAFHEALRDNGVDTRTSRNVFQAITNNPKATYEATKEALLQGGAEFFGLNIQPDRSLKEPTKTQTGTTTHARGSKQQSGQSIPAGTTP